MARLLLLTACRLSRYFARCCSTIPLRFSFICVLHPTAATTTTTTIVAALSRKESDASATSTRLLVQRVLQLIGDFLLRVLPSPPPLPLPLPPPPLTAVMELLRDRHVMFFKRCLKLLPSDCEEFFDRKPVLAFFSLSGLDLLNQLPDDRAVYIEWLYSMQYLNPETETAGFLGGFSVAGSNQSAEPNYYYDVPVVGMTYTALCCLVMLGDDLSRVHRREMLNELKRLQEEDGSFGSQFYDGEIDMRFVYCVISICYLLDDFSTIDVDRCVRFILSCFTYEGAIACLPGAEAHGGPTFCAVASLALLGLLDRIDDKRQDLVRWCLSRQQSGFNGRPNKLVDTCYSFWVGGTLRILDSFRFADGSEIREFVLQSQCPILGGCGKWDASRPDPMHSYLALAGLSFVGKDKLQEVFVPLNVSARTHAKLKKIHASWTSP